MNLTILEVVSYTLFIYILSFLFIFIKPNVLFISLYFGICFIVSWIVLVGCKSSILNNLIAKFIIIFIYSILCVIVYLIIHNNWNNILCKIFILVLPILFIILIKTIEQILNCDKHHIFTSPVRLIEIFLSRLVKLNNNFKELNK